MALPHCKNLQSPEFHGCTYTPELLELIFTKLPTISAQIRFCIVCRSWRSAAKSTKGPLGLPLLAYRTGRNTTPTAFLSPSTGTVCSINLPEAQGYDIYANSARWLALICKNQDSPLLNPLTRSTIRLPSIIGVLRNAWDTHYYAFMVPYASR